MTTEHEKWAVVSHPEFDDWLEALEPTSQEKVAALIRLLRQHGPNLGRPYADRIRGSRFKNLKELRPTSRADEALRVLYYFDKRRNGVLLVGGDKAGNWSRWYVENIPVAEHRIDEHLLQLADAKKQVEARKRTTRPRRTKTGRRRK